MAKSINFGGRKIVLPGAYSRIKATPNTPERDLDYGKILIIDTGTGEGYGAGSGVNGTHKKNLDSVYEFKDAESFRNFMKGGKIAELAGALFNPRRGEIGVSTVYFVRASTTTPATTVTTEIVTGVTLSFSTVDEGECAKKYKVALTAGDDDTSKYCLKFYLGDIESPILISKEVKTVYELYNWMTSSKDFNGLFKITSNKPNSDSPINKTVDKTDFDTGGTETYESTDLDKALRAVADLDYTFVLCDRYGEKAKGPENGKILAHLEDPDTRFEKFMIVGGGDDENHFDADANSSIQIAQYYDSEKVIVVHGGALLSSATEPTGFKEVSSLYTAAIVLGRMAGLSPQIPITSKLLNINGLKHRLTKPERRQALNAGVLTIIRDDDFGGFVIEQGINTLQDNSEIINKDAKSYSIQINRIAAQLNKEIEINAKIALLGQREGVNANTLSAQDVKGWIQGYLQDRTVTETEDNLILTYQDVVVKNLEGAWDVSYGFKPNEEKNKLFFTGFMIR